MDTDPDTVDSEEPNQEVDSSKGASSLSSDIDFEALKSLSQDGIDMSFLDELKVKKSTKKIHLTLQTIIWSLTIDRKNWMTKEMRMEI